MKTSPLFSPKEEVHIRCMPQTLIIKDIQYPERFLDKTTFFLNLPHQGLKPDQSPNLEKLHETGSTLAGKKVLVVDDDIRNIFAITSLLECHRMKVLAAENGRDAIQVLQEEEGVDIALMDIMMPEMDGYQTMQEIRKIEKFKLLPIIALTAKAMKEDRQKCIEAGASDFIAKPVDTEQLLSFLRIWIYR